MEEKKENRGGKREGAGRIKIDGKKMLLLLELDLYNAIDGVRNKTELINYAVRYALSNKEDFEGYINKIKEEKKVEKKKKKST